MHLVPQPPGLFRRAVTSEGSIPLEPVHQRRKVQVLSDREMLLMVEFDLHDVCVVLDTQGLLPADNVAAPCTACGTPSLTSVMLRSDRWIWPPVVTVTNSGSRRCTTCRMRCDHFSWKTGVFQRSRSASGLQ